MRIAISLPGLRAGKGQGALVELAGELGRRGHRVDVLVPRGGVAPASTRLQSVNVVPLELPSRLEALRSMLRLPWGTLRILLPTLGGALPPALKRLPAQTRYLRDNSPEVLLAATPALGLAGLWAVAQAGVSTRCVIRQSGVSFRRVAAASETFAKRWPALTALWIPKSHAMVAVSGDVADDLRRNAALPQEHIAMICDPVDVERIRAGASEQLSDPWFQPGQPPVIVAVGSLAPRNDFATLMRAVAEVRAQRLIRLMIFGEGAERDSLQALAGQLQIADSLRMPGASDNYHRYMARAAAVAYSAAWDTFPTVLVEALACGARIVSTDCHWGPSAILEQGAYGRLIPVANHEAFAAAILALLDTANDPERQRERASVYSLSAAADRYLRIFAEREPEQVSDGLGPQIDFTTTL